MNNERLIAGFFVGAGALMLLWQGQTHEAMYLLVALLSFFVGEKNGVRKAQAQPTAEPA